MSKCRRLFAFSPLLLFAIACTPQILPASPTAPLPTPAIATLSPTTTSPPSPLPPTPTFTATVTQSPITNTPPFPIPSSPFPFSIPIPTEFRTFIDPSYRYAATAGGTREPHNGVEFLNSFGTPVLAAADGLILFAGNDNNGSPYSPRGWYAFYGNFVIIEHDLPDYESPVYTLYAHLSEILTETGATVQAGDEIGLIGFTGAAVGSHLHFEVRYGGAAYQDSRNPELWLQPHAGNGSLAGSIRDAGGGAIAVIPLTLRRVDGSLPDQYLTTYEHPASAGNPPYAENFAIGELPAGTWELAFVAYKLETHTFEIRAGELTFIEIVVGE